MSDYSQFLDRKAQLAHASGFEPTFMPEFLYGFQKDLVDWSVRIGRGEVLADCGLGKSPLELCWAQNAVEHTNRPALILAPLAVSHQFVDEGEKFSIPCPRSFDGKPAGDITTTNYERLHLFDPADYSAVVLDEAGCIKNFQGRRRAKITEFMRTIQYRLLATATAAPNDYHELGTAAEALGHLGYMDMLAYFFINDEHSLHPTSLGARWRFKKAAEEPFWRWVCSWARACRRPSDLGFDDGAFQLPALRIHEHVLENTKPLPGFLPGITVVAQGMAEEREERKNNLRELCEMAAELVASHGESTVIWTDYNPEADLLEEIIPDGLQVSGTMSDEQKLERFDAFTSGELRVLITKPKIGAWGLNWQHCHKVVTFASHSFEMQYQKIRRCWRFGQEHPVDVDIVMTPGERRIMDNLRRKSDQAERMFDQLVKMMNDPKHLRPQAAADDIVEIPSWLT